MGKKYTRFTKATAYPVIARYFKENIPAADFCKKEGLSRDQLCFWRRRYMEDHQLSPSESSPITFHPVQVASPAAPIHKEEHARMEFEYPNGVILRTGAPLSDARIASLVKLF